jgi:hypothetical protein
VRFGFDEKQSGEAILSNLADSYLSGGLSGGQGSWLAACLISCCHVCCGAGCCSYQEQIHWCPPCLGVHTPLPALAKRAGVCTPACPADAAQEWDKARRAVLSEAVHDMLLPQMEREARARMAAAARQVALEEAGDKLWSYASQAPLQVGGWGRQEDCGAIEWVGVLGLGGLLMSRCPATCPASHSFTLAPLQPCPSHPPCPPCAPCSPPSACRSGWWMRRRMSRSAA